MAMLRSFATLCRVCSKQLIFASAPSIKRTVGLFNWYRLLYGRQELIRKVEKAFVGRHRRLRARPIAKQPSQWHESTITRKEMEWTASRLYSLDDLGVTDFENLDTISSANADEAADISFETRAWENVTNTPMLRILRRPILLNRTLYEYKVMTSFDDVPADLYFQVQTDLEYRKEWDSYTLETCVLNSDLSSGTELVKWVVKFPYPFSKREYIYLRNYQVLDDQTMIFVARTPPSTMRQQRQLPSLPSTDSFSLTPQTSSPSKDYLMDSTNATNQWLASLSTLPHSTDPDIVCVPRYRSILIVKPHTQIDENGFDMVLTYYDDHKANFSSAFFNSFVSKGCLDYLERLHNATRKLDEQRRLQRQQQQNKPTDFLTAATTTTTSAPPSYTGEEIIQNADNELCQNERKLGHRISSLTFLPSFSSPSHPSPLVPQPRWQQLLQHFLLFQEIFSQTLLDVRSPSPTKPDEGYGQIVN